MYPGIMKSQIPSEAKPLKPCLPPVGQWQRRLRLLFALLKLGHRIHNTTNETQDNGRDAAKRNRSSEENYAQNSNRQLVERTDHGVCRGGSGTDTPSSRVGDEDGAQTRVDHANGQAVARRGGEVVVEIASGPVLDEEGGDHKYGNSEEVVVVHDYWAWVSQDFTVCNWGRQYHKPSQLLKPVFLMTLRMLKAYMAAQKTLTPIHP